MGLKSMQETSSEGVLRDRGPDDRGDRVRCLSNRCRRPGLDGDRRDLLLEGDDLVSLRERLRGKRQANARPAQLILQIDRTAYSVE